MTRRSSFSSVIRCLGQALGSLVILGCGMIMDMFLVLKWTNELIDSNAIVGIISCETMQISRDPPAYRKHIVWAPLEASYFPMSCSSPSNATTMHLEISHGCCVLNPHFPIACMYAQLFIERMLRLLCSTNEILCAIKFASINSVGVDATAASLVAPSCSSEI